jgi:hypothetical protein
VSAGKVVPSTMADIAAINANLIEALRAVAKGDRLRHRFAMMNAAGEADLGRTIGVGEVLASAHRLPSGDRFTPEELVIADAACTTLCIRRPSDIKKAVASAIAKSLSLLDAFDRRRP